MDFDRVIRKIANNVENAFDDMDTDDIMDAIRENIDISEIFQEMYREDPDIRNRIKAVTGSKP